MTPAALLRAVVAALDPVIDPTVPQLRALMDVRALLQANAGQLDQAYLDRWIADLGLSKEWARAVL